MWYSMENRWPVSLSHTDTEGQTKRLSTQSIARVSLTSCFPTVPACVSNHFHAAGSRAWLIMWKPASHAPRPAVTSIGADTWQTLLRFHVWENIDMQLPSAVWVAPQTSFHYLPVPHRCFGGFRAVTREGLDSVDLLCCWWLFGLTMNGFTAVLIWDQIAICLGLWSLCKPKQ